MNKNNLLHHLLLLAVALLLSGPTFEYEPFRNILKIALLCYCILCLSTMLVKKRMGLFSLCIIFLIASNTTISLVSSLLYNSRFNSGFAMSVLLTDKNEAMEMLFQSWYYIPILMAIFLLTCILVSYVAKRTNPLPLSISTSVGCIFIIASGVTYFTGSKYEDYFYPKVTLLIEKTPFYNLSYFIQASRDIEYIKSINKEKPHYKNISIDNEKSIKNIILIVGESARRDNFSLYGYNRETTPYSDKRKNDLLIFENAYSPAPITIFSVPMLLSASTPENNDPKLIVDNLINIANASGYKTYWLSTQPKLGKNNTSITAISNNATHQYWLPHNRKDMELLPIFESVIDESNEKKLIVVHINGSHPNFCRRFDENFNHFVGSVEKKDCYDNSILYTDYIINKIIDKMEHKQTTSALVYTSDHGLVRTKDDSNYFVHGGDNLDVDAYKVPMFLWFSRDVADRRTGFYNEVYSTSHNFELTLKLMGVDIGQGGCASPLDKCNDIKSMYVLNANKEKIKISSLKKTQLK